MSLLAFALLFASAGLHTLWNLLLKQSGERALVTWWAVLVGAGLFAPLLMVVGLPEGAVWPLLLASVGVEVVYYLALSFAYSQSDFSLVYPLARGAAPALIAVWAVWFLGEELSAAGWAGLAVTVAGLWVVGGSGLLSSRASSGKRMAVRGRGVGLALLVAVLISVYSTIDAAAVRRTGLLSYTILVFLLAPLLTAPVALIRYRSRLWEVWRKPGRILAIGLLTVSAYLLALLAYRIAPLGYGGAVREVSVVFGALAGWRSLGEPMGAWRLTGALVIFAGIMIIAVWG